MSFSSGTFSINSVGNPVVTNTVISSAWANALTADLATGLSTCVLKDGTQTLTANIPMGSFKLTGLAAGSASGDSLRYEQRYTNPLTLSTEQATTSGTSIDFTGIPAGTKRITIMFKEVSTNGTSGLVVQIGDSGGLEVTAYASLCALLPNAGATATTAQTIGFAVTAGTAATDSLIGTMVLNLENSAAFAWVASGVCQQAATSMNVSAGRKALSAELDRLRITTFNGTDAFDAGAINISYE